MANEIKFEVKDWARLFHDTYERLAPTFGYKTRHESAKPWDEVPDANKRLMAATCDIVLESYASSRIAEIAQRSAEKIEAVGPTLIGKKNRIAEFAAIIVEQGGKL